MEEETGTPAAEEEAAETPAAGEEITGTEEMTGTTGAEVGAVVVSLVEHAIEMPATIPGGGPITFEITNNGAEEHGFNIEGEGFEASLEPTLQPGESGMLEVDLPPGTYEAYCPVGDHAEQGMTIELTVTG
jgi:uncharacterized cupredoxin-like copper-binding protein